MSEWLYEGQVFDQDTTKLVGFVYLITNLTNNRKYIGRKLFWTTKVRQVKLKKKKVKCESDWRSYYGSNEALKADVAELGAENFTREILHLCYGKGEANYLELREQIDRRVLESDDFYNEWFAAKVTQAHIKRLRK